MSRRLRSTAVAVLASLALVTAASTASLAQTYPPDVAFGVTCVSAGQAGASVTCTVVGADPSEVLTAAASYGSTEIFSGTEVRANAAGVATFRFTVPVQARGQVITVTVTRADGTTVASTEITIAAPGRTGQPIGRDRVMALPYTGQDAILLGAGGLILLAGGILALRRRGSNSRIDA